MVKGAVQLDNETVINVPQSGVVVCDEDLCTGCGTCELMCSLYNEGSQGLALSRLHIVRNPVTSDVSLQVCQQCLSPSCYVACPSKDIALYID